MEKSALSVHNLKALRKEFGCGFHCVDADALVDGMNAFLVVERHQERRETINIVAHVAIITAVAVCDKHIRRGDHRRENLFDRDVEIVPGFYVDGRHCGCLGAFAVSFDFDVFAEEFLRVCKHFVAANARDYTSVDICSDLGRNDVFRIAAVEHGLGKSR